MIRREDDLFGDSRPSPEGGGQYSSYSILKNALRTAAFFRPEESEKLNTELDHILGISATKLKPSRVLRLFCQSGRIAFNKEQRDRLSAHLCPENRLEKIATALGARHYARLSELFAFPDTCEGYSHQVRKVLIAGILDDAELETSSLGFASSPLTCTGFLELFVELPRDSVAMNKGRELIANYSSHLTQHCSQDLADHIWACISLFRDAHKGKPGVLAVLEALQSGLDENSSGPGIWIALGAQALMREDYQTDVFGKLPATDQMRDNPDLDHPELEELNHLERVWDKSATAKVLEQHPERVRIAARLYHQQLRETEGSRQLKSKLRAISRSCPDKLELATKIVRDLGIRADSVPHYIRPAPLLLFGKEIIEEVSTQLEGPGVSGLVPSEELLDIGLALLPTAFFNSTPESFKKLASSVKSYFENSEKNGRLLGRFEVRDRFLSFFEMVGQLSDGEVTGTYSEKIGTTKSRVLRRMIINPDGPMGAVLDAFEIFCSLQEIDHKRYFDSDVMANYLARGGGDFASILARRTKMGARYRQANRVFLKTPGARALHYFASSLQDIANRIGPKERIRSNAEAFYLRAAQEPYRSKEQDSTLS